MEPSQDHQGLGPCPSEGDLLCASSGDLPPDERLRVRQHLEHCPACRATMREQLGTLQAYAAHLDEEPPAALEQDARLARLEDLLNAARADREARSPRRWLAVAAALMLLVAGAALFRNDRVAYADEVVARAAQREHTLSTPADRWRLRFIPSEGDQTTAAHQDPSAWRNETSAPPPPQIIELLQAHGFDPRHPLSLAGLQAWRASHPDRREQVTHHDGWLVVQSSTTRGGLRHVEVVLDEASFLVVKQTWSFAGMGRVVCERVTRRQPPGTTSSAWRPEASR
jgi:hypothetical protein